MRSVKPKKCSECGDLFTPRFSSFQKVCEKEECRVEFALKAGLKERERLAKERKKKDREVIDKLKEKHKDSAYYRGILQTVFNMFIRKRDEKTPCISCGTTNDIQYHSGHYFSVGAYPNLRYSEFNANKQCVKCNNYLHGNLKNYRTGLIEKIGQEKFDELESQKGIDKKYTVPELLELITHYRKRIKELTNETHDKTPPH